MNAHHDNPTETRRQAIQAAIDTTRSAAERNRLGQFAKISRIRNDHLRADSGEPASKRLPLPGKAEDDNCFSVKWIGWGCGHA